MGVIDVPTAPAPPRPSRWHRLKSWVFRNKAVLRAGKAALGAADTFLGSIPGVEAIVEIKEVILDALDG